MLNGLDLLNKLKILNNLDITNSINICGGFNKFDNLNGLDMLILNTCYIVFISSYVFLIAQVEVYDQFFLNGLVNHYIKFLEL